MTELISLSNATVADQTLCFSCVGVRSTSSRQRSRVEAEQHEGWTMLVILFASPNPYLDPNHAPYSVCPRTLTFMDFIAKLPFPLTSRWFWPKGGSSRVLEGDHLYLVTLFIT